MASARVQGAAQGASIGGKIGGPIGAGIGAVIGGLSGKGSYAYTTGHRVVGTLGPDGFRGTAYGLAANAGQQYQDVLDDRYGFLTSVNVFGKKAFVESFGADAAPVQIDYTGPADGPSFWDAFQAEIRAAGKAAKAASGAPLAAAFDGGIAGNAPVIRYAAPGDPAAAQRGNAITIAAPGDPAAAQRGNAITIAAPAASGPGLGALLALAAGALYMVKHV